MHDAIHICTTKYWQTRINHLRNKKLYMDKITTTMYGGKARPVGKVDTRIGLFVFRIVTCKGFTLVCEGETDVHSSPRGGIIQP